MTKKHLIAAAVAAAFISPAFAATKIGGVNIDGWVLFEAWNDQHSFREGQTGAPSNEPTVFTLHNINFWGEGKLDDGLRYTWKVANRNRNGNFGGSGATGWREAYVGLEGGFGSVQFGRFLTKAWSVLDYPYGSPFWLAEATAETGAADWVTTRAVRYTAPELVPGLELEGTYDFGQTGGDAKARLFELFTRYSIGPASFDFVIQKKSDSPTTLGVGEYGADGSPAPSKGVNQSVIFLGGRYNFGGGLDATLGYKKNKWHNDAGGVLNGYSWNPGRPATPGMDVSNARILAGLTYRWDKWRLSGAVEKVQEGKDNVAGNLDDGATIVSFQFARQLSAAGAQAYIGLRHTKFNGTNIPVDSFTWQVQNVWGPATKSNTRFGIGAWIPF
jgi:hypothetical protein